MADEQEVKGGFLSKLNSLWKGQGDEMEEETEEDMNDTSEIEDTEEEAEVAVKSVEKTVEREVEQPERHKPVKQNMRSITRENDGVEFFKQPDLASSQVVQPKAGPAPDSVKEPSPTLYSDCESYLESHNKLARERNELFMKRFETMKSIQMELGRSLESIKSNPITLRSMSDLSGGVPLETVAAEAAKRRGDTFSSDSTSVSASLRDFETHMKSWIRMSQLTLEVAMLAPLPELGRPEMLQKSTKIFLNELSRNEELKIFHASALNQPMTLHDYTMIVARDIDQVMSNARMLIEKYFGGYPQPMSFNLFEHQKKLVEAQHKKAAETRAEMVNVEAQPQPEQKSPRKHGPGSPPRNMEKPVEKRMEQPAYASGATEAFKEKETFSESLTDMIVGASQIPATDMVK